MKLFKFTSFESGLKIIDTNSVLLKNPYEYNDPFDCSLVISTYHFIENIALKWNSWWLSLEKSRQKESVKIN